MNKFAECYLTIKILVHFFTVLLPIIEGIADAVASFTKMVSGYIADKLGYRKLLVLTPMLPRLCHNKHAVVLSGSTGQQIP